MPMPIQAFHGSSFCYFHSHLHSSSTSASIIATRRFPSRKSLSLKLNCSTSNGNNGDQDYLLDAPVSVGDGFSFSGGKYSDGPSPSDEWFKQGKMVKAYSIPGTGEKAKDPIFGLTMGAGSQATGDSFRWFCVESGSADNPSVILIHGFPSQAYSYRKILPILSKDYHAVAFDWLGFGFSDKPQPRYGFDYTLDEYVSSLESLVEELAVTKVSLVVQGYFSPVVVKYASTHQEKLNNLILLNPPLTAQHAKLPPTLSIFSNFLLGEIFSQDPLRASDKALTSCGPYKMKEEDAMVYRRPYLTSGSSGFALNALTRTMKKDLKKWLLLNWHKLSVWNHRSVNNFCVQQACFLEKFMAFILWEITAPSILKLFHLYSQEILEFPRVLCLKLMAPVLFYIRYAIMIIISYDDVI